MISCMISRREVSHLGLLTILGVGTSLACEGWVIRDDGAGPVKIGMSLSQLNTALHEKFAMPKAKDEQGCFYGNAAKHPHVSFMIEGGRLARIDVDSAGISTMEGVQVGDSEKHALQVYGPTIKVEDHNHIPEGRYLTIRSKDSRYGISFEKDSGKIQTFYAGRFEAVQYVERCQ